MGGGACSPPSPSCNCDSSSQVSPLPMELRSAGLGLPGDVLERGGLPRSFMKLPVECRGGRADAVQMLPAEVARAPAPPKASRAETRLRSVWLSRCRSFNTCAAGPRVS